MCFQGFVHYQCGHAQVWEEECAHAQELDIGFWLKVACPYYSNQLKNTDSLCGTYKYYCKRTKDGEALEQVHDLREKAEEQYKEAHNEIMSRWGPVLTRRAEEWRAAGNSVETFIARPEVKRVKLIISELNNKRDHAQQELMRLDYIINRARTFFARQKQYAAMHGIPLSKMLHPAGVQQQQQPNYQPQRDVTFTPGLAFAAGASQAHSYGYQPSGDNVVAQPMRMASTQCSNTAMPPTITTSNNRMLHLTPQQLTAIQHSIQNSLPEVKESEKKRARAMKKAVEESSPEKQSSSVRRSTRTRGKKINYAEEASEVSRSPSPNKSEISNFSPSKSDVSGTPTPARGNHKKGTSIMRETLRNRASASLADKIGEWNRRETNAAVAGTPPPAFDVGRNGLLQVPGSRSQKRKLEDDSAGGTPETIVLQMDDHHAGDPNPSNQTWTVNSNPLHSAGTPPAPLQTHYITMLPENQTHTAQAPSTNYQQLHKNFNSTTDLFSAAMPSTVSYESPNYITSTEPMKRQPLDSSPSQSAERMRMSMPDQMQESLSPSKIASRAEDAPAAPPFDETLPALRPPQDRGDDLFSDIDWNVLDDDSVV